MKHLAQQSGSSVPTPGREAVLYVRVSSKEQEREGFSIPAQRKLLTEYAAQHGLDIINEFEDIETAKRAGRTGFSEMVRKVDSAYEDRLASRISDGLWQRKSAGWEAELAAIRRETARHERASHDYGATGSKILELAKNAHNLFVSRDPHEQARLLKMLVSNCRFDRGSLSVAYVKPFDLLVEGNETGNWLGGRDSFPFSMSRGRDGVEPEGELRCD